MKPMDWSENYKKVFVRSGYLRDAFYPNERTAIIRAAARKLRQLEKKGMQFDAVAFRGVSGALIAPTVADKLGKMLIVVRKPDEKSHSAQTIEGFAGDYDDRTGFRGGSYVIIDDVIESGLTVRTMVDAIKDASPTMQFKGVYTYNSVRFRTAEELNSFQVYGRQSFTVKDRTCEGGLTPT